MNAYSSKLASPYFPSELLQNLHSLLRNGLYVDVTLTVTNEESFRFEAHRCILAAASPVLNKRLQDGGELVEVQGVTGVALATLVKFVYSGELTVNEETCSEVLGAAQHLELARAVEICEDYVAQGKELPGEQEDNLGLKRIFKVEEASDDYDVHAYGRVVPIADTWTPEVPATVKKAGKRLRRSGRKPKPKKRRLLVAEVTDEDEPLDGSDEDEYIAPKFVKPAVVIKPKTRGRPAKSSPGQTHRKRGRPCKSKSVKVKQEVHEDEQDVAVVASSVQPHCYRVPPYSCRSCPVRAYLSVTHKAHEARVHHIRVAGEVAMRQVQVARKLVMTEGLKEEDGTWKCYKCSKSFPTRLRLKAHAIKKHLRKKRNPCFFCGKSPICNTVGRSFGQVHRCQARKEEVRRCEGCQRIFKHEKNLKSHQNICRAAEDAFPTTLYMCRHCKKPFSSHKFYICHLFKHGLNEKEVHLEFTDVMNAMKVLLSVAENDDTESQGTKLFPCEVCGKEFRGEYGRTIHMRRHTGNMLKCDVTGCTKSYTTRQQLTVHQQCVHAGVLHYCPVCKKEYKSLQGLRTHKAEAHGPHKARYTCTHCNKAFSYKIHFDVHVAKHADDKPYDCFMCLRKFAFPNSLLRHQKTCNVFNQEFKCTSCGKAFKAERYLKEHEEMCHGNSAICEKCGKAITSRASLWRHKTCCAKEKNVCNFCGETFKNEKIFNMHVKKHVEDQPYVCPVCFRKFAFQNSLCRHKKICNVQENKFLCKTCGRAFKAERYLKEHEALRHDGATESLKCKKCSKYMTSRGALYRHKKVCCL